VQDLLDSVRNDISQSFTCFLKIIKHIAYLQEDNKWNESMIKFLKLLQYWFR